jgi:hypothetical protein
MTRQSNRGPNHRGREAFSVAQRSVSSTLKNDGKHDLVLERVELDHGIWSALGQPPARIPQGAEVRWGSESNGFMTGTEGTALYAVGTTGAKLKVYWDNPFVGDNTFTQELELPPPNGGPGVPDYIAFDPMRPNNVKTPLEPVQFETGSDIEITYRFQQAPAEEAFVSPTPTAQPDPSEPRTPVVPVNAPTTVQDPAAPRKLIYIGLTSSSAFHEEKSLSKQVGTAGMISITKGSYSWVKRDSDFESQTAFIPTDRREKLNALEAANDPIVWTHEGERRTIAPEQRLLALRSLAAAFGRCDPDLNPNADTSFTKRLCISAHHCYDYTNQREDVLWGDKAPSCTLTLFNEGDNHGVLQGLADIFPTAFANVEDLMLSACNMGQDFLPDAPKLFALFKNLKTIWAYEGSSPGPSDSTSSKVLAHSSTAGLLGWETASRRPGAAEDIKKMCKDVRNKGGGPCVMWVDGSYVKHERT